MFAPVVLPFQITCAILLIAVIAIPVVFCRLQSRVVALLAVFLLFVPSCTAVMLVVDQFRYGRFDYATAAAVPRDGYIELPPSATDIELHRSGDGHAASFVVATEELLPWIAEKRSLRPELQVPDDLAITEVPEHSRAEVHQLRSEDFSRRFGQLGWKYAPELIKYHVARSSDFGGYTIWHLPATGDTFLDAGYW